MTKKYFFFDIDGTLTTQNPGGTILPSTLKTLEKLKENGHFVAIATGRSFLYALDGMKKFNLENMVHNGGNGITMNSQLVEIMPLDHDKSLTICLECVEKNIPFIVVVDAQGHCVTHDDEFSKEDSGMLNMFEIEVIPNLDYHEIEKFMKIFVALKPGEEHRLTSASLLGYSRYCDHHFNIEPDDKSVGIKKMMEILKASIDDVVVFGDQHNDLTMFQMAKTSIAMGNAIDELKEIATFVTKSCDEDGIEYACQYFGWI